MSLETYGWMVLLFPLAGAMLIGLTFRLLPSKVHGYVGTARDRAVVPVGARRAVRAAGPRRGGAPGRDRRVGLREHGRRRRAAVAAARPAVDLHGARRLGRLDADPPLLRLLHGVGPRLHALLRVPELLRVQHAAARPGRELLLPDRRLGVRRRGLLPADLVLVPARDGDARGHQGVRDQRGRRRRPRARDLLHLQARRHARLPRRVRGRRRHRAQRRRPRRGLPAAAGRRVRQVRAGPAPHLAPGRDGGPDAGLRPDPRRHDGHRGRLPDRAHAPVLRAGADRGRRRRDHRLPDAR